MTKRKRQVSDNNVSGGVEKDYFDKIPFDLVLGNILSRLPVKSMAKCRCVSKHWSSIIRPRNYNQLFPVKSPGTPKFLIAVRDKKELNFYSSPRPQNSDNNSSLVATPHDTKYYSIPDYYNFCSHIGSLVCSQHVFKSYTVAVVSNPITGEYITSPKVKKVWSHKVTFYFGYDPIEKQYKVLCVNLSSLRPQKYRVLTLETGNLSWRKIQCCTIHHFDFLHNSGTCIDGVLYYMAILTDITIYIIVCFDIRSEKFRFVTIDHDLQRYLKYSTPGLINYKDRLGIIIFNNDNEYRYFKLWVLEDAEDQKWSYHFYRIPQMQPLCLTTISQVYCIRMVGSHEIVFYQSDAHYPFRLHFYNLEGNSVRSVEVPAIDRYIYIAYTLSNYVDDVQFIM